MASELTGFIDGFRPKTEASHYKHHWYDLTHNVYPYLSRLH